MPFSFGPATSNGTDEDAVKEPDGVQDTQRIEPKKIEGYLSVNASIGGQLQRRKKDVHVQDLDTGEVGTRSVKRTTQRLMPVLTALGILASIGISKIVITRHNRLNYCSRCLRIRLRGGLDVPTRCSPNPPGL